MNDQLVDTSEINKSRNRSWWMALFIGSILGLAVILISIVFRFALPQPKEVQIGRIDDFPVSNEPYMVEVEHFTAFLVNNGDQIIVFNRKTPRINPGCIIHWFEYRPGMKRYIDPCSGSRFTLDGRYEMGPASADMDRYKIDIRDREIFVEVNYIIKGARHE